MKKILFTISCLLLLMGTQVYGQFCQTYDQTPPGPIMTNFTPNVVPNLLDNWGTLCGNLQYADDAFSSAPGNVYLKAFDQGCSTAGSWMFNGTDFNGDWTQFSANNDCFCYDFRMIDFGNNAGIPNSLMIYSGNDPFTAPLRARFILNTPVAEADGWVTICAPTDLSDGVNLPGNAIGQWQMVGGGTAAGWDALIANVTGVAFYLDIGNSPSEIYGFDNICVSPCPPCGSVINENVTCVRDGYEYTFEVENTSGLTVDGIDIDIPGVGYDPTVVIPNGGTYSVTVTIPEDEGPIYCFNVLMYSGIQQCCDFSHCVDLPICNPCEDVFLFVNSDGEDGDECCYEIGVSNNVNSAFFTGINTTILTPGVNFDNPTTTANWTVTNIAANMLNWSPPGQFMAQVSYLNPINFCFTDILQTHQMPQTVVFDWLALDDNGQEIVVCSDTLTFNCEPCMVIENKDVKCLDDGTFEYCFGVTNNGDDPASQLYLDPYGPAGTTFTPNPVPVSLAPGETGEYCVNVSGVSSGDVVEYKALLKSFLGDTLNWCCIVDTFRVEMPECDNCVCDEAFFSRNMGFLPIYSINSCKGALSPFGIDDCYEVTWRRNGVVIGQTMGNQALPITFWSKYASYCMTVSIPGTDCVRQFCRKLRCNLISDGPGDGGSLSYRTMKDDGEQTPTTIKNIYPNPVEDVVNVSFNQNFSEARVNVQIINAMGETVLALNNQILNGEEIQVRVNDLSEGIYFLRVDGENIQSDFLKFVKLK